jgi:hypothetical protein
MIDLRFGVSSRDFVFPLFFVLLFHHHLGLLHLGLHHLGLPRPRHAQRVSP